jgi:hypothetical protein
MILVNTKSCGQRFHSTLYEFDRNTVFDGNDWFSNHSGSPRAVLRYNQFGGNIGGYIPIPKISPRSNKKAFFFFNYEGTRASKPSGNPGGAAATYYVMPQPSMLGIGTPNEKLNSLPSIAPATCAILTGPQPARRSTTPTGTWYRTVKSSCRARCSKIHLAKFLLARPMPTTLSPPRSSIASTLR